MTLNGVMALILRYFTKFGSFRFRSALRKVVEGVVVKKFRSLSRSPPDEFLVQHCNKYCNALVLKYCVRFCNTSWSIFMVALCNRADHYIFMLWFVLFLLLLSFFSSPNLSSRRLDVYHTSAHGVVLV